MSRAAAERRAVEGESEVGSLAVRKQAGCLHNNLRSPRAVAVGGRPRERQLGRAGVHHPPAHFLKGRCEVVWKRRRHDEVAAREESGALGNSLSKAANRQSNRDGEREKNAIQALNRGARRLCRFLIH
jgi:hypothetical protein